MNVSARRTLVIFWKKHPETESPLKAWLSRVRGTQFMAMKDVMGAFPKAKALNGERVRFEILSGNYRLIVGFELSGNVA
ncbi:MAG: type II toxin-antitoxin system HigB family toxin [Methylocella sp.]